MKAMILGAGKGTRMQPLSFDTPKPLIPFLGTPVMDSIINHLKSQGVDQVIINTAYLSGEIERYFQSGHRYGVEITYSYEGYKDQNGFHDAAVGSAGGIANIHQKSGFFDGTFIVLCGDALVDVDLCAALKFHRESKALATVILKQVEETEVHKYGIVELSETGKIAQFQEKPQQQHAISNLANVGIYLFEPEILNYIPKDKPFDIGGDLLPLLAKNGEALYGFQADFSWIDIGNLGDYLKATQNALQFGSELVTLPGSPLKPGLHCGINTVIQCPLSNIQGNVVIGSGCVIEAGAKLIGPLQIGSNCRIESGVTLSSSIIDDYTHVKSPARIHNKIIYQNYCIDDLGRYWSLSDAKLDWLISDNRSQTVEHELSTLIAAQNHFEDNVVYVNF